MTHLENMLPFLKDDYSADYYQKLKYSPFPKFTGHIIAAGNMDDALKEAGKEPVWTRHYEQLYEAEQAKLKSQHMKTDETKPGFEEYPVPVIAINVGAILGTDTKKRRETPTPEWIEKSEKEKLLKNEIRKDLHRLGIVSRFFVHSPGEGYEQMVVTVPAMKLEEDKVMSDLQTKIMTLAYLIYKGYATQKDIPSGSAVYKQQDLYMPFDQTIYKFASSAEYQNKVRKGLGEELLSEPKIQHSIRESRL